MAKLSGGLRSSANFRHLTIVAMPNTTRTLPPPDATRARIAQFETLALRRVANLAGERDRIISEWSQSQRKKAMDRLGVSPRPKKSSSNWPSKPKKPKKQPHQSHAGHDRAFLIEAACERFAQELESMVEASPPKTPPPPAPAATSTSPRIRRTRLAPRQPALPQISPPEPPQPQPPQPQPPRRPLPPAHLRHIKSRIDTGAPSKLPKTPEWKGNNASSSGGRS